MGAVGEPVGPRDRGHRGPLGRRRFEPRRTPNIYALLAEHQKQEDWEFRDHAAFLLSWARRYNLEFKLQLTELALRLDALAIHIYSLFHAGHNQFGLRGEITINVRHFATRARGLILADLLHEVVHAWQHEHGRPADRGRHNREYRRKAAEVGLVVTPDGRTGFVPSGPFDQLIGSCGFALPSEVATPPLTRPLGDSKLKKWSCGCTIARVAVADFRALCLKCDREFVRDGGPAASSASSLPADDP